MLLLTSLVALTGCGVRPGVDIGLSGHSGAVATLPPLAQTWSERTGGPLPHERFEFARNDPRVPGLGPVTTLHWPEPDRPYERPVRFRLWEQR